MPLILIDAENCKGCGLCVAFCPRHNLVVSEELNDAGYRAAEVVSQEECTGCKICTLMCPDACIGLYRSKVKEAAHSE